MYSLPSPPVPQDTNSRGRAHATKWRGCDWVRVTGERDAGPINQGLERGPHQPRECGDLRSNGVLRGQGPLVRDESLFILSETRDVDGATHRFDHPVIRPNAV